MNALPIALATWVGLSIPVALLLARMFRTPSFPVTTAGYEDARPETGPGRATNVPPREGIWPPELAPQTAFCRTQQMERVPDEAI